MKEPIKPRDIQHGDLIRWESAYSETAREFRHTDPNARHTAPGNYFLLDRPKPAVDLPTEPTLGWLGVNGSLRLGIWAKYDYEPRTDGPGWRAALQKERDVHEDSITAFAPATAVPTEALDELRNTGFFTTPETVRARIKNFLAAVDAANGDHA